METEELAKTAAPGALALTADEVDDMFGDSAPDQSTPLSFNNYGIVREMAQFQVSDDDTVKTLTGHILYKHCAKQYFESEFDPSNPSAPECYSIDGVKPAAGCEKVQCGGLCVTCQHDKYGTAEKGEGKACKDTVRFLFLPEGAVLPVTVIAPPTSLAKKGPLQSWLNSVMNDVAAAYNAIGMKNKAGGPIVDYWWAKVELSLEKKTFDGGTASILKVKTLEVITPNTDAGLIEAKAIHQSRKTFNPVYLDELQSHVEQADADPVDPQQPVPGEGNEAQGFNDEPITFDEDGEIPT